MSSSFAQRNGEISNGGFENWTDVSLYDYPTLWGSSNTTEYQGVPTVIKSADAQDGIYSAEIVAAEVGSMQDTAIGYVYHGSVGNAGPDGGISYTDNLDEVRFQYKCYMPVGDTLFMILIRYINGIPIELGVYPAAWGTQATWTQGTVSLPATYQNEIFIGFIIANPFGSFEATPGSWVRIDNIKMYEGGVAQANVPDHSFEQWSVENVEVPDDWYTMNELLAVGGLENANKTTDANSGAYAIEMTTILEPFDQTPISSYISLGPIDFNQFNPFLPIPYNATPTTFSGAYKYAPVGDDQAGIQIDFFEMGANIGTHWEPFKAVGSYTTFSSALTITGMPDSISFMGYSGDSIGSVLFLDDLNFSGGNVGLETFESMSVSIYPNPTSSTVMIKAEGTYDYIIVDLAGNVVMNDKNIAGAVQLDINHLSSGIYIIQMNNAHSAETHKLIVE